jgi:hypothetical protein
MKIQVFKYVRVIPVFLMLSFISASVDAALYTFSQGGFTGGGVVTGSFRGVDRYNQNGVMKPDGWISACFTHQCNDGLGQDSVEVIIDFSNGDDIFNSLSVGTVTDFAYNIKGNYLTFSYDIYPPEQLFLLYYDPNSGFISFSVDGIGDFEWQTNQPVRVSNVPLPGSLGLFSLGVFWLNGMRRRNIH